MNCHLHQLPIIGFSQKIQLQIGLCSICLAEQIDDFVFTEEANFQIDQFTRWVQEVFDSLSFEHTNKLKSAIQQLQESKNFFNQSIDKLISNISDWITTVSKQKQLHEKTLKDIRSLDFNQVIKKINKEWYNQEKQFKRLIFGQISKLLQKERIVGSIEKIKEMQNITIQFPEYKQEQKLTQSHQDNSINFIIQRKNETQLNLKCDWDHQNIIMIDINRNVPLQRRLKCVECIQRENGKYISIKEGQSIWNVYKKTKEACLKKYQNQQQWKINQINFYFEQVKQNFISTIDNGVSLNNQQSSIIFDILNKEGEQIARNWETFQNKDVQIIAEILSFQISEQDIEINISNSIFKYSDQINKIVDNTIIQLQEINQTYYNKIKNIILKDDQHQKNTTDMLKEITLNRLQNQIRDEINYKLLDQYKMNDKELYYCFCFNKDNNLLVAGCLNQIKIFTFVTGKLTQVYLTNAHRNIVTALYVGTSNKIYSCGDDCLIRIWVQDELVKYKLLDTLKDHTSSVYCIEVNQEENLLITGSYKEIKFWVKNTQIQWICVQTLQYHNNDVNSLSLSNSQNSLLSCGNDKNVNIFKFDSDNDWVLMQTITVDETVHSGSFIGDNIIVFLLARKGILRIYENNKTKFYHKQDLRVQGSGPCQFFFPQIYCKQQSILVLKNCQFLNIIRVKNEKVFTLEQAIEFKTQKFFGTMTNDGQYLITWDTLSNQIQLRFLE